MLLTSIRAIIARSLGFKFFGGFLLLIGLAASSYAQLAITFQENEAADTVTITFSGSAAAPFALAVSYPSQNRGFTLSGDDGSLYGVNGASTAIYYGSSNTGLWSLSGSIPWSAVAFVSGPDSGGGGFYYEGSEGNFGLFSANTSTVNVNDTLTWNSAIYADSSLADIGIPVDSGSFAFTNGTDTVTINWTASAFSSVPEPSTYAAILGAVALIGVVVVRRRASQS